MPRRQVLIVLLASSLLVGLAGCDVRTASTRCRPGSPPSRDASHVLICRNGRWTRSITVEQAVQFLGAIRREKTPVKISAGRGFTCVTTQNMSVRCWGGNAGQLGDGTTAPSSSPVFAVRGYGPMDGPLGRLATGDEFACVSTESRTHPGHLADLRCWGENGYGQIGDGTTVSRTSPVRIDITRPPDTWLFGINPALGRQHACTSVSSTAVWCWGSNAYGQLGDGTTTPRSTPHQVMGLTGATEVAAGRAHTCALTDDGTVRCWGANSAGQLGDGTTTDRRTPVEVSGLARVQAIAAGGDHTCALIAGGTVKCWGDNSRGMLGDTTRTNRAVPVEVFSLSGVVAITAGLDTTCAVVGDGTLRCWGANQAGQVGDGTTIDRGSATLVPGLSRVTSVSAGSLHTCAVAADVAWCWGANDSGQLGDGNPGTDSGSRGPVRVAL